MNSKAALLVMDVQPGIISRIPNSDEYISHVKQAVSKAHAHGILVIYVVVGFRAGFPEISSSNKGFSALKGAMSQYIIDPKPVIEMQEGDILVTKKRVSAFAGSDLEMILRANEINHLVLTGIATSGVVLSTLREAADKDFQLTVLSDLCRDMDDEVHRVLTEKVFPRQASVITAAEWMPEQ